MLGDRIELGKSISKFLQLVNLLVSQLFRLLVLFLELGKLLCQICQALRRVLDLLEYVRLALLNQVVKLLFSPELIDLQLPLQLLLLLDLLLSRLQIALQVEQEVGLLDHLKTPFQLVVLFHQIHDGFIGVLKFSLSHRLSTSVERSSASTCWRLIPSVMALTCH